VVGWAHAATVANHKIAKPFSHPGVGIEIMLRISSCHRDGVDYTLQVRISWKLPCLALLLGGSLLVGGCGGLAASQTISPLDFLLPGLIKNDAPQTNAPVMVAQCPVNIASTR
jgi:hypothetical protein